MNEELILQSLEGIGEDLNLYFQAIIEAPYIYIYINRDTDTNIDYAVLTEEIRARVAALEISDFKGLYIYSRYLGLVEPDWETFVDFHLDYSSAATQLQEEEPESAIALSVTPISTAEEVATELPPPTDTSASSEEFNLSKYCFIRNRRLLSAELQPPSSEIARAVSIFHDFSNSIKQQVIPELEKLLTTSSPVNNPTSLPEVSAWFDQLSKLDESGIRKASIWFSRYCFNPIETADLLAGKALGTEPSPNEVSRTATETAIEVETSDNNSDRQQQATKNSFPSTYDRANIEANTPKKQTAKRGRKVQQTTFWQKFAFPICLSLTTVLFVVLAIFAGGNSQAVPDYCKNYPHSPNYCQLAAQLVGESVIEEVSAESVPITENNIDSALKTCDFWGSMKAGNSLTEKKTIPVIESNGGEALPGIYLIDIKHQNLKEGEPFVRTACVFQNTQEKLQTIAQETIPNDWPAEPYRGRSLAESLNRTNTIYSVLARLFGGTLFTAVGIYVAAVIGLSIRVYSLQTVYKAASLLSVIEAVIMAIPGMAIVPLAAIECVGLFVTSSIIKDFKIDWSDGYRVVAMGALVIVAIRGILSWMLFLLIFQLAR